MSGVETETIRRRKTSPSVTLLNNSALENYQVHPAFTTFETRRPSLSDLHQRPYPLPDRNDWEMPNQTALNSIGPGSMRISQPNNGRASRIGFGDLHLSSRSESARKRDQSEAPAQSDYTKRQRNTEGGTGKYVEKSKAEAQIVTYAGEEDLVGKVVKVSLNEEEAEIFFKFEHRRNRTDLTSAFYIRGVRVEFAKDRMICTEKARGNLILTVKFLGKAGGEQVAKMCSTPFEKIAI